MSRNTRGTIEPIASSIIEDDELAELAQNIACPECGDAPTELVRVLSPDDATDETLAAFKGGLAGALTGGVAGSPFGPGGVGVGMAGGAIAGSDQARKRAKKERLVVSCPSCGYQGRAN